MISAQNGLRTRESVWTLQYWDDTLLWYARAIAKMRSRNIQDPMSWRYQAAIHGYDPANRWNSELQQPGDRAPSNSRDVWNQCQHGSWFFLPWHRGYLGCLEDIVRETIRSISPQAADDWALPYWNYSDPDDWRARLVRPEFIEPGWPDEGPNPLSAGARRAPFKPVPVQGMGTAGDFGLDDAEVSLVAMDEKNFTAPAGATSFGGGETGFSFSGDHPGQLEITPHGDVHMAVGYDLRTGERFWMGSFRTAGLDPLFWLHHCNLDRLWSLWLRQTGVSGNPSQPTWLQPSSTLSGQLMPFVLHRASGAFSFVPEDVRSTISSPFAYRYDDDPQGSAPSILEALTEARTGMASDSREPELIGSTSQPLLLEGGISRAKVRLTEGRPSTGILESLADPRPSRTFLRLQNIITEGAAAPHRVYLRSGGDTGEAGLGKFVGSLPMFGVEEASQSDSHTGGSGMSYTFDVTDAVADLPSAEDVEVVVVPKEEDATAKLRVGKISFYRR